MGKSFEEVAAKISQFEFREKFDMIVAVANGGIIPAAMINQRLGLELQLLKINLRDPYQRPIYDAPQLLEPISFDPTGRKILLVEDRVKTGASLRLAQQLLSEKAQYVRTFAVNGPADYSLYDEACFKFPWIII